MPTYNTLYTNWLYIFFFLSQFLFSMKYTHTSIQAFCVHQSHTYTYTLMHTYAYIYIYETHTDTTIVQLCVFPGKIDFLTSLFSVRSWFAIACVSCFINEKKEDIQHTFRSQYTLICFVLILFFLFHIFVEIRLLFNFLAVSKALYFFCAWLVLFFDPVFFLHSFFSFRCC